MLFRQLNTCGLPPRRIIATTGGDGTAAALATGDAVSIGNNGSHGKWKVALAVEYRNPAALGPPM
jgi:hypothetical protein